MKVEINRKVVVFEGCTISDLIKDRDEKALDGLVVIVNRSVILKHRWNDFKITEADSVFMLTPAEGG